MAGLPVDDRDLDDAALWAVIDSAAATISSQSSPNTTSGFRKPLTLTRPNLRSPPSPSLSNDFRRPHKIQRSDFQDNVSPIVSENFSHCLSARFPTVSLFNDYQRAAMSVLEKSDYTMISGNPFIKKSGWRKIAFYFNVSFEIKDKSIEFDDRRNVQRAEFVVRAYMQGGRFSDGWGSCELREKKFMKPNHDIPSTAETRAKNKACQDLIGIGQYRPGASHSHFPSPR